MAEENRSIFFSISDALRGNRKDVVNDLQQQNKGLIMSDPNTYDFSNIQQKQQEYLDVQSLKIAQDLYGRSIYYDSDRITAYNDYRAMDLSPEISVALDIMADECVTRNDKGEIVSIYSENARIKKVLKNLFQQVLNVDYNLWFWTRELLKYGDNFLKLEIDQKLGVYEIVQLPMGEIHKEIGYDGNPKSVRFKWDINSMFFEDFQIAHFSLVSDGMKLPYGRSVLDPARKLWKQLQLAEDAMLVYRLTRAPERRVFYIEVGNSNPADIRQYIESMKREIKKSPVVDPKSGNVNLKYNPMTFEEDYFLPIRNDKGSRIEVLPGASNLDQIQDIEYLQNKLFTAIKVPKTYLNYAESIPGGSTLSQADLRFSRTINRIQEMIIPELRRIANIHLYFLGFKDDMENFTITLTNPSTQQELLKLETMKARNDVFKEMFSSDATSPVSYTWAMEYIQGFSKSEIKQILRQKKIERKIFYEIERAHEEYMDTGLFTELDKKFRKPDFDPNTQIDTGAGGGEGGAGGGGGSSLGGGMGNMDLGGMGGADMGGAPDMSGAGGGAPMGSGGAGAPPAGAELTGGEEAEQAPEPEDQKLQEKLFDKNFSFTSKTRALLENIDNHLRELDEIENDEKENIITESDDKGSDDITDSDEEDGDVVLV